MRALLFFKRATGDVNFPFEIAVEVRQMVCFNGFNTKNAFRMGNFIDCKFKVSASGYGDFTRDVRGPMDVPSSERNQWETIAIGWNHEIGERDFSLISTGGAEPTRSRFVSNYLNFETGMPQIISLGATPTPTRRVRTLNEIFLGKALSQFYGGGTALSGAAKNSTFLRSVAFNYRYNYGLFDFVGSERPSGMAVAYLQVYRNTSRALISSNPLASTHPVETALISLCGQTMVKSVIPILADLFQQGQDSDILSFSGQMGRMLPQAMKFGIFSLSPFFRNHTPMCTEGRYNKGGQAEVLGQKLSRTNGVSSNDCVLWTDILRHIRQGMILGRQLKDLMTLNQVTRLGDDYIDSLTPVIRNYLAVPSTTIVTSSVIRLLNNVRDAHEPEQVTPRVDQSRLVRVTSGFMQWVSQNDGGLGGVVQPRVQTQADQERHPATALVG